MIHLFSSKAKGFIQLVLVIAFIIGSFAISGSLQSKKPVVQGNGNQDRALFVETQTVTQGPHRIAFETTGIVEALVEIDVVPQVSGRVVKVNQEFFAGGGFEKDETLFEIDPRDFELEVERLEAELARAQTALTLEKAESETAITDWQRTQGNKKVPDLVARKPQIAEAEANLRAAKALLKDTKLDLERTKFSLPFQGQVLSSMVAEGRYVTAGQDFGRVFDVNALEVRTSLEDQKLEWLLNEANAEIQITTAYLGRTRTYKGVIKRGTSALDPGTRFATVSFGIEAMDDKPIDLLPGVFATIQIKGPNLQDITKLPSSALQRDGIIWKVDEDDRLLALDLQMVYANDTYIAARGIQGAVDVVTSKIDGAARGMKIMRINGDKEI